MQKELKSDDPDAGLVDIDGNDRYLDVICFNEQFFFENGDFDTDLWDWKVLSNTWHVDWLITRFGFCQYKIARPGLDHNRAKNQSRTIFQIEATNKNKRSQKTVIFQREEYTKLMGFDGWFFKGGSTQNRWVFGGWFFKGGSTWNRWALMDDFSKGGVHKTDGFWKMFFASKNWKSVMKFRSWFKFRMVFKQNFLYFEHGYA